MGPRIWLPATVAALSLTLAGCDSSADPVDQAARSPGGPTSADHSPALVGAPDDGTCWTVPADVGGGYWFDDSPTVPCNEPHTTETVLVLRLTEPTIAEAKQGLGTCFERVRVYLGVDLDNWVPWMPAVLLPSREQIADGANWMRCDAAFPASWDFRGLRATTGPASGVAVDPPAELWACLDEHPKKPKQSFVPCDQPHQYEQTGKLAILEDLKQYPAPGELAAATRQQCSRGIRGEETANIAVTARWDPRSALRGNNTSILGACFMFNKTGQPVAPRP
jgi:Septum formation